MVLGGVLLAAGMELDIAASDHLNGDGPVHLFVKRVVEVQGDQWVVLEGHQHPTPTTAWKFCRVAVRISALKRSLTLGE